MPRRLWQISASLAISATIIAAALPGAAGAATPRAAAPPACPVNALQKVSSPVQITLWHQFPRANEQAIQKLTDQFNSSQNKVHVTLVNQTTYQDLFNKYVAGLSTGDLPDVAQIEDEGLQQMIDTRSVLPIQSCIKADHYTEISDFLDRAVRYYTVKGVLYAMPFNVSAPVLYYNKKAFTKAGLDPNQPPQTLDQIKADAQKLKASGAVAQAGFGLKNDPWYLQQWLAKTNNTFVNNGNGRNARATQVTLNNATGQAAFAWMADMVKSGLAVENDYLNPSSAFNNLLGIGNGNLGMTIDTSAALGTIEQLLSSGQYPNVELGVATLPSPPGNGGFRVGGAALYISAKSSPQKQAAAWQYLKFLDSAASQAQFAVDTGYIPNRKSAVTVPALQARWAQVPGFRVAYDELLNGAANVASSGPVFGDYLGVRQAITDAEGPMFTGGTSPKAALAAAISKANSVLASYNSRVGG
jgi:sn-glycerol 3-phosphate transport system substrate-binding protein